MEFKTTFHIRSFDLKINYDDKLFFIGSCFAENISAYFERFRFQVVKNPFGILYHPYAIKNSIDLALNDKHIPEENSFEYRGLWSNFDAHSSLSSANKETLHENLSKAKSNTRKALQDSNVIFISLGTAWAYQHIEKQKVVANCHKLPQENFNKRLLDVTETKSILSTLTKSVLRTNPQAKIVFTLSPVRHLKDGFVENQLSKSTLHLAIHEIVKSFPEVFYFPSYEILLDDLRDYRFYASDFLHPNELALDYIWQNLKEAFFDSKTLEILQQIDTINKRLAHRFFNPKHTDSIAFQQKTQQLILAIQNKYAHIQF